jgi:ribosomal protein S24E
MAMPIRVIKIAVTDPAKKVIQDIAKKHGMKEQSVASRIYQWFAEQDDIMQKHVLQMLPNGYEIDVLGIAAERYKGRKGGTKG